MAESKGSFQLLLTLREVFDHKGIVSLAVNKQLFKTVEQLEQPKIYGTSGIADLHLASGREKTPNECSTRELYNAQRAQLQLQLLLPSLKYLFYDLEQCSSFELLKVPAKLGWGQQKAVDWDTCSLRTEFEQFLSQDKSYELFWLIYRSAAGGH